MKRDLDTLLMLAVLASINFENTRGKREHELPPFYIHDKPPTGSKEYWFDSKGNFSTERMRREDIFFKCFAINDKNAKRKFNKYVLDTLPF